MKTISLSVSESDYEEFRALAQESGRSIASLIRDAMSSYLRAGAGIGAGAGRKAGVSAAGSELFVSGDAAGRYVVYAEVVRRD